MSLSSKSSSGLYSHSSPKKLLEEHLKGVADLVDIFLQEKPDELRNELLQVCKIVALMHDIGKATKFFQDYLCDQQKPKGNEEKYVQHSFISAVCAYFLSGLVTDDKILRFFAYVAVKHHHGALKDLLEECKLIGEEDIQLLSTQLASIDRDKFLALVNQLADYLPDQKLGLDEVKGWIDSFEPELKCMKRSIREFTKSNKNFLPYLKLNLIFSLLLDADKSDVVVRDPDFFRKRVQLSGSLVDVHKSKFSFPETPINHLRERAYKEVTERHINLDEKIYSLNLPTGLGKTLTALSFALKLREKLNSRHRIIYTLPFLSIIDQNSTVFEEVLRNNGIGVSHKVLLKHHHLSEISYKTPDTEYETTQAKILIEGWNSEIIVTTFVQLFESLISNENRNLRKFHRIANSIIILDEVQSIPIKYWRVVSDLFYDLTKYFNVYVILVTATEPLIFDREKLVNLVDKQYYFKQLDRIYIKPRLKDSLTLEELASQLQEFVDEQKSYLFIFNTISAAEKFYGLISERYGPTTFLSTHVIPRERLDRINAIRKGQYRIVVSTQLVEAGVDIDFDVVARDMAPLDSIIQSAGRCNRNSKNSSGKGEVLIFSLKDDSGRHYHSYIYDPILTDVTGKILKKYDEIPESKIASLIEEYYSEVESRKSKDEEIIKAIKCLNYYSNSTDSYSVSNFRLIENFPEVNIFIEFDDEAKSLWREYLSLSEDENPFRRREKFDSIKGDFYKYVVSVSKKSKNLPPPNDQQWFRYVPREQLEQYYDLKTGFITKLVDSFYIF